jgi:hypothetical protein
VARDGNQGASFTSRRWSIASWLQEAIEAQTQTSNIAL